MAISMDNSTGDTAAACGAAAGTTHESSKGCSLFPPYVAALKRFVALDARGRPLTRSQYLQPRHYHVCKSLGHASCSGTAAELVSAASSTRDWLLALGMLQEMQQKMLKPSVTSIHLLAGACRRQADWQGALDMLTAAKDFEKPSLGLYMLALGACTRVRESLAALQLLTEMRGKELEPGLIGRSAVMLALALDEKGREAAHLLDASRQ
eukprot:6348376-Amphidinium_carterae.1